MSYQCRICDHIEGNRRHTAREMMFGLREEFPYIECVECGCLQIETVPDDLSRFYPSDYYSFSADRKVPGAWKRTLKHGLGRHEIGESSLVGRFAASRYPHWSIPWVKRARPALDDAILDVGCGGGGTLLELAERGYRNLTGIDPFIEKELAYDNGVRIFKRDLSQETGRYRCVLLSHVFEHLPDPETSLRDIHRVLAPGCLAVIRIPVSQCEAWRQYGVNWVQLDAPRHLFLHNERTIAILADKVGFVVEDVIYDSNAFQFAGSEGYLRNMPLMEQIKTSPFPKSDIEKWDEQAVGLNAKKLGDQASFFLKKR